MCECVGMVRVCWFGVRVVWYKHMEYWYTISILGVCACMLCVVTMDAIIRFNLRFFVRVQQVSRKMTTLFDAHLALNISVK